MSKNSLFSKIEFLDANKGKNLNFSDYLHAIFKLGGLPLDLVFSIKSLFSPEFQLIDNSVFLTEIFSQEVYDDHVKSGESLNSIQFWMNLLEITAIFEDITVDDAIKIATDIIHLWNLKLADQYGISCGCARMLHDEETDEVFIVIDKTD